MSREDIPITDPEFWRDEEKCSEEILRSVFRSTTSEEIPLFNERMHCLREAGEILQKVAYTGLAWPDRVLVLC